MYWVTESFLDLGSAGFSVPCFPVLGDLPGVASTFPDFIRIREYREQKQLDVRTIFKFFY